MWQTKYAAAIPKNLGVGVNFRPCCEGRFLSGRPQSVSLPHRKASNVQGLRMQDILGQKFKLNWSLIRSEPVTFFCILFVELFEIDLGCSKEAGCSISCDCKHFCRRVSKFKLNLSRKLLDKLQINMKLGRALLISGTVLQLLFFFILLILMQANKNNLQT